MPKQAKGISAATVKKTEPGRYGDGDGLYLTIRASKQEGVWYFTLRNGFDPGARFMTMPENRVALRSVRGRVHREAVHGENRCRYFPAYHVVIDQ